MLDLETIAELRVLEKTSPGLVKRVFGRYLDALPQRTEELEAGLTARDAERMRAAAHALKGDSFAVGARTVGELVSELEEKCKAGDLSDARARLDGLYGAIAEAQAELFRLTRG